MIILDSREIRNWDEFTLNEQGISSISLMKKAAKSFTDYFINTTGKTDESISIFCGSGNNGGDGLAVAINLRNAFYNVDVFVCHISEFSKDNRIMFEELKNYKDIAVIDIYENQALSSIQVNNIVIDGIFGTGLSRPVTGYWNDLIDHINNKGKTIFSIDTPSGLFSNTLSKGGIIKADYCGTFQSPKLTHLIPETEKYLSNLSILDIGLSENFKPHSSFQYFVQHNDIHSKISKRSTHAHKGNFGHTLLLCGSKGMAGAMLLCAKACLRSGTGKLSLAITEDLNEIAQLGVPEAMTVRTNELVLIKDDKPIYDVIACGCGIGTSKHAKSSIDKLLDKPISKMIFDADALNIIARESWVHRISPGTVITPHVKEFDRLFGSSKNTLDRLKKAKEQASSLKIYIVLKGAYTCTSTPEGNQFFNSTGNPGMATAGSGDVLTGILAGMMAQKMSIGDACLIAVYLHGMAGDLANEEKGEISLIASDIIQQIPTAIKQITDEKN